MKYIIVGSKNSATSAHFIQSPRPMSRRKKHPRMDKKSPNCQETLPRTILSLANQDRKKEGRHALKDSLSGHPKKKDQHSGSAMGAWWRSNFRRICHLHIKCPQLTIQRINEEMTPKQYCSSCCNSQEVGEGGKWDKHSSSDLHDQQMEGQDQRKRDILCKKPSKKGGGDWREERRLQFISSWKTFVTKH